jgi:hypothetical protein
VNLRTIKSRFAIFERRVRVNLRTIKSRFAIFERHVRVNLRTIKSRFAIFQMYNILHCSRDLTSKYLMEQHKKTAKLLPIRTES